MGSVGCGLRRIPTFIWANLSRSCPQVAPLRSRMRSFPLFGTRSFLAIVSASVLCLTGCGESEEARAARLIQERQEQLAKDQKERVTLIAQTKAALVAQER